VVGTFACEGLNNLHSLPNIIWGTNTEGEKGKTRKIRNAYNILEVKKNKEILNRSRVTMGE
jgi:hypothetical protein